MSQKHDAFQNSGHDVFVQVPHTDARNKLEDFVLGGSADDMITFKDAILPDRKVRFSALIINGVLSQFGKHNEDFIDLTGLSGGGFTIITQFETYKGKLYAVGFPMYRVAIADHSALIIAQTFYNTEIEDWDNVGNMALDPFATDFPQVESAKVAKAHGLLIFAGLNSDGWTNDGTTFIGILDQAIGWDGDKFIVIMNNEEGSISQINQVAKFNNTVAMYLFHSASAKFRMLQYDGETTWTLLGDAFVAFEDTVHKIFDGVVTTIGGVKQEYLFFSSITGGGFDLRYLNALNVWTTLATLGIYTIDRVDEIVTYKKGIVLYGKFFETATPANTELALHWVEVDGVTTITAIGQNALISPAVFSRPEDAISLKSKDIYIADVIIQTVGTNEFNGFGKYNEANDDYDTAWKPDPAYSEYDIDDAIGVFTTIGRFNVRKLKKTDPQP